MGREARARQEQRRLRQLHREEPRFRLQPSRRGVATVFLATAALGAGVGLVFAHFFG